MRIPWNFGRFLLCGVCVDVRKPAPCTWRSFCVSTQKKNFWSFCGYAHISHLWSLWGRRQNHSTHRAEFLLMYANEKLLEFLRICTYFSAVEFVWTYAKPKPSNARPLHAQGKWITQMKNFWSFCRYAQTTLLCSFCDRTQKKAPRHYWVSAYLLKWIISGVSADMHSYWNEKKWHQLTRYADNPILEFLRPYADTPNVDEILPVVFVIFFFLLVLGVGCGLWLWHSLGFSINYFYVAYAFVDVSIYLLLRTHNRVCVWVYFVPEKETVWSFP